jgi:hypothetical protein
LFKKSFVTPLSPNENSTINDKRAVVFWLAEPLNREENTAENIVSGKGACSREMISPKPGRGITVYQGKVGMIKKRLLKK